MTANRVEGVSWFTDPRAEERGEPGLWNTYLASLGAALRCMGDVPDPAWLMGVSGFAFRITVNQVMCPSAMSVFDWTALLPEAVEQAGLRCTYVSRLCHEEEMEEERRLQAHDEILRAVDRGVPAIVWDVHVPEWGLIVGYDTERQAYETLGCDRNSSSMPFDQLGRREIKILSVTIPGEPNRRPHEEIVRRSLEAAVRHAEGGEWAERPRYIDGPRAYDLWAAILEPGRGENTSLEFGRYYAAHWYGARRYAADYLNVVSGGEALLEAAAGRYDGVADLLRPVWEAFSEKERPDDETLKSLAVTVREARGAEEEAVRCLAEWLRLTGEETA